MSKLTRKPIPYERKKSIAGFLFILPWLLGFVFIVARPLISSIGYAFSDTTITTNGMKLDFAGLTYFIKAFRSDLKFPQMLSGQLSSLATSVPIIVAFSLFMAVILVQDFKGRTIARAIFFIPVVVGSGGIIISYMNDQVSSTLISGARSQMLFSSGSFSMTNVLLEAGLSPDIVGIISSVISNVFELTWKSGLQIVLFIAALQSVSPQLYEAADVEGASAWEKFWKITFPMVMPIMMVNLIYTIIDDFTDYGNGVLRYIVSVGADLDFSYSSAMSWIYFVIITGIIGVVYYVINRRVTYTVA